MARASPPLTRIKTQCFRFDCVGRLLAIRFVPAWRDMTESSERFLGHRHNYARRMIENRVKAGYTRRDAIVEALTGWALSPKPTEGGKLFERPSGA